MTEHERDDELSRRYRELAREEPPRALDDAILAAARREVEARPAPLVAPTGRRRWFVPVAAAAVIVLSAVVTLHVQREQPDMESTAPQYTPPAAARKDEAPAIVPRAEMKEEKLAPAPKEVEAQREQVEALKVPEARQRSSVASAPKPSRSPAGEPQAAVKAMAEPKPPADPGRFTPDPAPAAAPPPAPPAPAQAPQMQMRPAAPAVQPAPRAEDSASVGAGAGPPTAAEERRAIGALRDSRRLDSTTLAKRADQAEPPEKMLERIATLRREGRDREADELYAEFKKRFPDYRIPDAMREQVLPR